ncbi:MAG: hypothetical protein JXB48_15020 [Candidatus Latescibacteria bacterium]|nr:hypothetical protein [Candidatus Latescibacterota bacterium]
MFAGLSIYRNDFNNQVKPVDRVGGGNAPADLPHRRAYGSVPWRFMNHIGNNAADAATTRVQEYQWTFQENPDSCAMRRNSTTGHARWSPTVMHVFLTILASSYRQGVQIKIAAVTAIIFMLYLNINNSLM